MLSVEMEIGEGDKEYRGTFQRARFKGVYIIVL
jgi:hypothetical protein